MMPALSIWRGDTTHVRLQPFMHRFRYPLAMISLDLDRLEEAGAQTSWLRINQRGLFSFYERDFGAKEESGLRDWSCEQFRTTGIQGVEQVILLCQPRILGYQFNPISLHFGYSADGKLLGIIYEVHNTFGEGHAYVARTSGSRTSRHTTRKQFHVSPFFDVSGSYEFRLRTPSDFMSLAIRKTGEKGSDFTAILAMRRKIATNHGFARWFFGFPVSTLSTIAAIHLEALKLWMKGARYHNRPSPPAESTTQVLEKSACSD